MVVVPLLLAGWLSYILHTTDYRLQTLVLLALVLLLLAGWLNGGCWLFFFF